MKLNLSKSKERNQVVNHEENFRGKHRLEEMVFDMCAMLKDKPRETQLAYTYVCALTGSKCRI